LGNWGVGEDQWTEPYPTGPDEGENQWAEPYPTGRTQYQWAEPYPTGRTQYQWAEPYPTGMLSLKTGGRGRSSDGAPSHKTGLNGTIKRRPLLFKNGHVSRWMLLRQLIVPFRLVWWDGPNLLDAAPSVDFPLHQVFRYCHHW